MKHKMLIWLCLIATTTDFRGDASLSTKAYLWARSCIPGRSKRVLSSDEKITIYKKNDRDESEKVSIANDPGTEKHSEQKNVTAIELMAIQPWEYLEISDKDLPGNYIIYDSKEKKFKCIHSLWWHPYLPGTLMKIGGVVATAAVFYYGSNK